MDKVSVYGSLSVARSIATEIRCRDRGAAGEPGKGDGEVLRKNW